jgi:Xaa-Pro aminopeptidase
MKITIEIPYELLLKAIIGLSKEQKKQLQQVLEINLAGEPAIKPNNTLQELLLKAPTWNEEEYQQYLSGREHLNQFNKQ